MNDLPEPIPVSEAPANVDPAHGLSTKEEQESAVVDLPSPPDEVRGFLGEDKVLLGLDQKPIGAYRFTREPWTVGEHSTPVVSVEAIVHGTSYRGVTSPKVGAAFRGLSPSARKQKYSTVRMLKANRKPAPAPPSPNAPAPSNARADAMRDALTEMACLSLRREVVDALKIVDPDSYAEYTKRKYGASDNPSLEVRRAAYVFAFERLLARCYTVPEFP